MTAPKYSAAPLASTAEAGSLTSRFAVFERCRQLFGLGIDLVREVLPSQPLPRVPRAAEQVLGVASLRGEILPVVALDRWLDLPAVADDPNLPILVLRRAELLVGLRVDAIRSVQSVPMHEVQPHPGTGGQTYLTGIWHPAGLTPITLIAGAALLEALCLHMTQRN